MKCKRVPFLVSSSPRKAGGAFSKIESKHKNKIKHADRIDKCKNAEIIKQQWNE